MTSVLMVLSDGLAGDQEEVVRGTYRAVGATIPLVGGCAGDDLKMASTFQFHGNEVLHNAVVAAAIASDVPLGIGVRHGWRRVGEPMVVTGSEGNRLFTLDDQPALDLSVTVRAEQHALARFRAQSRDGDRPAVVAHVDAFAGRIEMVKLERPEIPVVAA